MVTRMAILVPLVLLGAACAGAGLQVGVGMEARVVNNGTWGGEHIALTVTDSGAHVEFDCAYGDIEQPLTLDADGKLDVPGVFVQEHAGPVRAGEEQERKPVRYTGRVDGKTMALDVILVESKQKVGSFTLTLGAEPRVRKCR